MPDLGVVMLTSYSDDEALFQAIQAGAAGTSSSRSSVRTS
jgi:DNA-binding NarL/FixJ family response regulator